MSRRALLVLLVPLGACAVAAGAPPGHAPAEPTARALPPAPRADRPVSLSPERAARAPLFLPPRAARALPLPPRGQLAARALPLPPRGQLAARALPLPPRGHLTARARLFRGPRVMNAERTHGRTLTMFGNTAATERLLVAGCVNGTRCAGTDVVNAATIGCPPTDAELWYFGTLDPRGADLDAAPGHPGAAAWRQATADLRPRTAIVFRTGPAAAVRATGASAATARRFARLAHLPFVDGDAGGLAGWTERASPRTAAFSVELPGERVSARRAAQLAYAIDRLAGTRFADGARQDRARMISLGRDPRVFRH